LKKKIFILDDEPDMVKIATDLLTSEGYFVQSDTSPISALKKIPQNPPDLLLLDIKLPEKDGFQVCREMKDNPKTKHIPIIMISVKADESDVVVGLELGAEDYISKPYRRQELLARVKKVLRRQGPEIEGQKVQAGPLRVDYDSYNAWADKKQLNLTPKEFELLGFFLRREGRVVTRACISEHVWGTEFTGSTRTIDVHVDQLRKKLGRFAEFIKSLKGVGYRFELDD